MIDWPVKRRSGCRWARWSAQRARRWAVRGAGFELAAMAPPSPHESAAPTHPGDRDGPGYESYVASRGGVVSAATRATMLAAHMRRHSRLRQKVRTGLFGLSHRLARAEHFRPAVQGQRLPARQRSRLPHLVQPLLLADRHPHDSAVAPGAHDAPAGGCRAGRPHQRDGGADHHPVGLRHLRRRPPDAGDALQGHHLRIRAHRRGRRRGRDRGRVRPLRQPGQVTLGQPEVRQVRAGQHALRKAVGHALQQRHLLPEVPLCAGGRRDRLRVGR